MASDNLIHIRLDYEEALASKKDILSSQIALLKIARTIRGYGFDRAHELELKMQLQKNIKELKTSLSKLHRILPKIKIPKIIRKEEPQKIAIKKSTHVHTKHHDESLENQLQEIQRKLNELQSRGV